MKTLKLGCTQLDDLFGGGIESGILTKIYGEAGTGKTNICLQASRECVVAGGKVAYVDTEGVSVERLHQICANTNTYQKTLENILFFTPASFTVQEKLINNALTKNNIGLLVVDTINFLYRIDLENNREGAIRSFIRQMTNLQIAAREKDLPIILTEQVYTDKNGAIKPFTTKETGPMVKTIIQLDKTGVGKWQATLIKHRSQPKGKKVFFRITKSGLE